MALSFQILPARGLVYVKYDGMVSLPDTRAAFAAYTRHPDCRPGQKQLVDLKDVTGWDNDFPGLMEMQAKKAETFVGSEREMLLVYYAPTEPAKSLARTILRSWDDVPGVVPLFQDTEARALSVLGQPETSFESMLQAVLPSRN